MAKSGLIFAAIISGTMAAGCAQPIPPEQEYEIQSCLQTDRWPEVIASVQAFGRTHDLDYHGEIEPALYGPDGKRLHDRMLNTALVRGLHQLRRDDLDLWLTTNPFDASSARVVALAPHAITPAERALADQLQASLAPYACPATKASSRAGDAGHTRP